MPIWDSFTNKYSLSKTLRFELKPTPETKSLAEVIKKDRELARLYKEEMKPMLDHLHEKFVTESLSRVKFDIYHLKTFDKNLQKLREFNKNRSENQKEIQETENSNKALGLLLKKSIEKSYENTSRVWIEKYFKKSTKKINFSGYEILTKECVLSILEQENPDKAKVIKEFKGFFTYFTGFNQNRANYYTNNGKATEVSYRLIDENLVRFLNNRFNFQTFLDRIPGLSKFKQSFDLEDYDNVLTQEKIDYFNEQIIGRINSIANQYCHSNKIKLPKLKILYRQIGSSKSKKEIFEVNKGEEWKKLQELIDKQGPLIKSINSSFGDFFADITKYDLEKIYLNKQSINTISSLWLGGGWQTLAQKLVEAKVIRFDNKKDEYKIPKVVTFHEIKNALSVIENQNPESLFKEKYLEVFIKPSLWLTFLAIWKHELEKNFAELKESLAKFEKEKKDDFWKNKKANTELVKKICDGYLSIERMVKYHKCKEELDADSSFYESADNYLVNTELDTYYNAFRNHLTKKPFSKSKVKLNFDKPTLFNGWSDNKNDDHIFQYGCTFIRDNEKYFVAILHDNGAFSNKRNPEAYICNQSNCQIMTSKLLRSTTIYGSCYKGRFGSDYKDDKKSLSNNELVDRVKSILEEKKLIFPELQTIIDQSFDEPNKLAIVLGEKDFYTPNFIDVDKNFVKQLEKEGSILLFEITNQNLLFNSANPNIHTLYFKQLFSNINDGILKLDASAKIFFREKSIERKVDQKRSKNFKFKIIESRRYTEDKFLFYFTIKINFTRSNARYIEFNRDVNKEVAVTGKSLPILGIDRGEKYLLYYSLISPDGKIVKQGSFNRIATKKTVDEQRLVCENKDNKLESAELVPTGKKVSYVDYHLLLDYYEKKRILARQSWQEIGRIKDLKEGYLSQVVHEIYKLVIDHNAIVVLEDLNSEFKAKRLAKVEKSVYKKFELSLAKKLGHLVMKDRKPDEKGGVLNAYQLAPQIDKVSIFEKAKQWGVLFYVRPDYTSTTDPLTGWRKHLYISNSAIKKEFEKYFAVNGEIKVGYDFDRKCYKFTYADKNKKTWILYAYRGLSRFHYDSKKKRIEPHDLHAEFESLFSNFDKNKNINEQIAEKEKFQWSTLIFYWNLLNQIRNTDKLKQGNDNDFLQSPAWSKTHGCFYDSREADEKMPQNGDANGAYNIARKGILVLDKIRNHAKKDPEFKKSPDLFISNDEWDNFAQKE